MAGSGACIEYLNIALKNSSLGPVQKSKYGMMDHIYIQIFKWIFKGIQADWQPELEIVWIRKSVLYS